jgi:hypothetical protein
MTEESRYGVFHQVWCYSTGASFKVSETSMAPSGAVFHVV